MALFPLYDFKKKGVCIRLVDISDEAATEGCFDFGYKQAHLSAADCHVARCSKDVPKVNCYFSAYPAALPNLFVLIA